ncbi:hypothetical protein [Novosphingobium sp.]|uniref:hypothetical protein n=1 Tax=Novosphingobium sp. TaxID=1874826 RepID=UPI00301A519B
MIILSMPLHGPAIPFPALRLFPGVALVFFPCTPVVIGWRWRRSVSPAEYIDIEIPPRRKLPLTPSRTSLGSLRWQQLASWRNRMHRQDWLSSSRHCMKWKAAA